MIDPPRLREGGSETPPELSDLFRGAQKPEPLPATADAKVGAQVTALAASSSAPLAKLAPFLLAGGAVLVAGAMAFLTPPDRGPNADPGRTPVNSAVAPPQLAPAPVALPVAESAAEAKPAPVASAARAAPPEVPSASEDALAGEAKLLNQAHAAMATDPQKALAIAGEHAKRYPRGQLAAERELILVQALVKLGRTREAEARGRALRKSTPSSIYGDRLDTVLKGK